MSDPRSLSRRAALAGLGAGGLSLAFASHVAAGPPLANRETGGATGAPTAAAEQEQVAVNLHSETTMAAGTASLASHPLTGLWLATVRRPSNPDETIVVPSVFSADGTVMLMFPISDVGDAGVQLRGVAIGTWEALDYASGHFTAVQVLSDSEGAFKGSVTIDGYPRVLPGGASFEDNSESSAMMLRDSLNRVIHAVQGAIASSMVGSRMSPGHSGFVDATYDDPARLGDPR
jgi:hypothetical protein